MFRFISSLLLTVLITTGPALGATYSIDKAHSTVGFKIRHLVGQVRGVFADFEGAFDFDEKNPSKSKGSVTIQTASINTQESKRDEHLKSVDFFDASKFPVMKFESAKVSKKGKDELELAGNLTIRDVTKPVKLNVLMGGIAKDPWGNTRSGFSATAKINRKDFGIVWNKTLDAGGLLIGDEVFITIEIEAIEKKEGK